MIIIVATDDHFVQHCSVTIVSILKNNKDVTIYILTEGLRNQNVQLLEDLCAQNNGTLHIINVPSSVVQQFPMPSYMSSHISIATYYRLFASELLPPTVDKAIYLDCDIVVRDSLDSLWNTDVMNYALGAVYQHNEWADNNDTWSRLQINREEGYFNAGLLLLNLKYWRKKHVKQRFLNFITNHFDAIHSHDQDVLNAVLSKETKPLCCTWNFLPLYFDYRKYTFPKKVDYLDKIDDIRFNPVVVHYVYKPKPWQYGCKHPFKSDYFFYLDKTSFKGWRPPFSFREYFIFIAKPFISIMLKRIRVT